MFHLDDKSDNEDYVSNSQLSSKKIKLDTPINSESVHSSLGYTSFKAPPLVEYNSIESYCEKKLGKSLLPSHSLDSPTISDLNKVKSISSPIVLKSPNLPRSNRTLIASEIIPPHIFFTVEELSLVKCLSHWSNTKVCPVGLVEFDVTSQQCYIHSVLEKGSWQVLLDTSLLKEIPKLKTVLQIFGCVEIVEEQPVLKVHFSRNLGSTNISLFLTSYKLMQKQVPNYLNLHQLKIPYNIKSPKLVEPEVGCQLNDTLDDYNLSIVEKCIKLEEVNKQVSVVKT